MLLDRIELKNIGGFTDFALDLPGRLTVLVGRNGSGKSTLIAGVGIASQYGREFDAHTIRVGALEGIVRTVGEHGVSEIRRDLERQDATRASWPPGAAFCFFRADRSHVEDEIRQRLRLERLASEPTAIIGLSSLRPRRSGQLHASGWCSFVAFEDWFRRAENQENEIRLRRDPNHRSPELSVVREALEAVLTGVGGAPFSDLRVTRVGPDGTLIENDGILFIDKAGVALALSSLSDGERSVVLMVATLGQLFAEMKVGLAEGRGLVLIDEVEAHLHPAWQRALLPALLAAFPVAQFVVTTHSPVVLASVPSESIRILKDWEAFKVHAPTSGRDSNSILAEVLDVPARPDESETQLRKIEDLIDAGDTAAAKEALHEYGRIVTEADGEFVRLDTLLRFIEA